MSVTRFIVETAAVVLAIIGLAWIVARVFDGLERAWYWLRRDRVTPLLEDDEKKCPCCHEPADSSVDDGSYCWDCELYVYELASECNNLDHTGNLPPPLPPERTWEQMTTHQLPLEPTGKLDRGWALAIDAHALLRAERERRPPAYEAEARAHYVAMGLEYPSGLMARVREAAP